MNTNIELSNSQRERVERSRIGLLLDNPFFGTLALKLELKADYTIPTLCTNMIVLKFNPSFTAQKTDAELLFILAHEVMHDVLAHPLRLAGRDFAMFNKACDYVINDILAHSGFKLPKEALYDTRFNGMTSEAVYDTLIDEQEQEQEQAQKRAQKKSGMSDSKGKGGGCGASDDEEQDAEADESESGEGDASKDGRVEPKKDGKGKGKEKAEKPEQADEEAHDAEDGGEAQGGEGSEDEEAPDAEDFDPGLCGGFEAPEDESGNPVDANKGKELEGEWKVATAQAATSAKSAGQLGGVLKRVVEDVINPKLDWKTLLHKFFDQFTKNDYTWQVPNRRFIGDGLYMPSLYTKEMKDIVVAVDTSASITDKMLNEAATEISQIAKDTGANIYVISCDYAVTNVQFFTPQDLPFKLDLKGGGGTAFNAPFEYVAQNNIDPACLIYITDLQGSRFAPMPDFPVLWIQVVPGWGTPGYGEIIKTF